jgi:hypothetical protein
MKNEEKKGFIIEKKVVISTTIPLSVYSEIKEKGLHYNTLIFSGLAAEKKNIAVSQRLNELETGNAKLSAKLGEYFRRLYELEKKEE